MVPIIVATVIVLIIGTFNAPTIAAIILAMGIIVTVMLVFFSRVLEEDLNKYLIQSQNTPIPRPEDFDIL